jgi:CRP-like cAMP-binding protein
MNKAFENLKLYIAPFGLPDNDFDVLFKFCEIVHFDKGDVVMKAGDKQNYICYINKGFVRNFVLSQDAEIKTYGFRTEGMLITGYALHNYKNEHRAKVSIECLEECEMVKIPLNALKYLEEHSVHAHKVGRFLAEAHTLELVEYIVDIDILTVTERFQKLENIFPNIQQRVPQHIIASYLGITPVYLSKIKKRKYTQG